MDNARSKHVSTLVGNCPDCTGYVRVPLDAKYDASARCPHCGSTFTISHVLEQIPELEIVDSPAPEKVVPLVDRQPITRESVAERKKFEVPHQLISGSKKKRHRSRQSTLGTNSLTSSSPKSEFSVERKSPLAETSDSGIVDPLSVTIEQDRAVGPESRNSARAISAANAARVRVHSSQRHRRMREDRKSSPVVEIIKIVLGGLLAFPIAYLILLWGIGQDPLQIAPMIGKAIPFAVPKSFRQIDAEEKTKTRRFRAITPKKEMTETDQPQEKQKLEVPQLDIGRDPSLIPGELERQILSVPDVAPDGKSPPAENPKKD